MWFASGWMIRGSIMKYILYLLLFISAPLWSCELVMGYRTNAKPPFISAAPDHSGLYQDLYTEAAERINCRLKIERYPKARVLYLMRTGEVDFYPGLSFSEKRSEYLAFLPNGLKDGYIGLTRKYEKDIHSLQDVADRKLVMVVSFGSYDLNAEQFGINVRRPYDFNLARLVDLILVGQADFHAYNLLAVKYFLQMNPEKSEQLKVHEHCCAEPRSMFFSFSKNSDKISVSDNPDYQPDQPFSATNNPVRVKPESIAWQLFLALESMREDGRFQQILDRYFSRI